MTKVPLKDVVSDLWADLTAAQKWLVVALVLVVAGTIGGSWWNTFSTWNEIRGYQNAAIAAKRESDEALARASKIVTEIQVREQELVKVEVKRDEKRKEVEQAKRSVDSDRAEYDRAVVSRRADIPSTDELCAYLATVGHPCQPR